MSFTAKPVTATIAMKGALECRDDAGNLLGVIDFEGKLPVDLTATTDTATQPEESQDARIE